MSDIHFDCPKCSQAIDAPQEMAAQLIDCPSCKEVIEVPIQNRVAGISGSNRRIKYEHLAVVLHFDRKKFAITRTDLLQGLTDESNAQLHLLGEEGWELVSVLPYTTGRAALSMFTSTTETDAAMGFFKRIK
ncbi:MAG TPA: hypothetical protein VMH87_07765 [Pseudomonadales bacterium]|nr:hypothetical protein [Pseudomonadales bacterium]